MPDIPHKMVSVPYDPSIGGFKFPDPPVYLSESYLSIPIPPGCDVEKTKQLWDRLSRPSHRFHDNGTLEMIMDFEEPPMSHGKCRKMTDAERQQFRKHHLGYGECRGDRQKIKEWQIAADRRKLKIKKRKRRIARRKWCKSMRV